MSAPTTELGGDQHQPVPLLVSFIISVGRGLSRCAGLGRRAPRRVGLPAGGSILTKGTRRVEGEEGGGLNCNGALAVGQQLMVLKYAMRSRLAIGIAVLNCVAFQTSPIKVLATITLH